MGKGVFDNILNCLKSITRSDVTKICLFNNFYDFVEYRNHINFCRGNIIWLNYSYFESFI